MQLFGSWLAKTRELQINAYGADPAQLQDSSWTEFVRWNVLAAQVELGEMLQELPWKPWAIQRKPTVEEKRAARNELVDVLHFIGNIAAALDTDDELMNMLYEDKMRVNADRQRSGTYAGRDGR